MASAQQRRLKTSSRRPRAPQNIDSLAQGASGDGPLPRPVVAFRSRQDVLKPQRGDPVDLGERGRRLGLGVIGETALESGENVGLCSCP